MPMNYQGPLGEGPGIEWCTHTWNVVTGCKHGCSYCYVPPIYKRFGRSFDPQFHPKRLCQPLGVHKPAHIFVCSTGDLFGDWVPNEWIEAVLDMVKQCPQHTFQFLTKNPQRLSEFGPWPDNCWVGMSITNLQEWWGLDLLDCVEARVRFVSFEPLLNPLRALPTSIVKKCIDWAIIGEQTGPGPKPDPADVLRWATDLITDLRGLGMPIFVKRPLSERMENAPKEVPK